MSTRRISTKSVRFIVRRRVLVFGFAAGAVIAVWLGAPATGAPSAPPNDTFEIAITSGGTVVAPGGSLTFEGTCWSAGLGPAQDARVRGYLVAGPGITQAFDFWVTASMNQTSGHYVGAIAVPGDAPNGVYALEVTCSIQDQSLGSGETPFTVDGPLVTTTTTTSSTTTTVGSGLTAIPVPAPVPARPLSGTATLTG